MKYCMRFYTGCRNLDNADEVILKYTHKTAEIIDYVKKYKQEQRIILNAAELDILSLLGSKEILTAVKEVHPNIALMLTLTHKNTIKSIKEFGIDYFFIEAADTWDKLNAFVKMGVSDIYVINEFAFSMVDIARYCHERNIKVRAYANVAQSSSLLDNMNTITSFFIRPEDVQHYENHLDVIEFFGPIEKQDVLYEIYTKGKWLGNLKDLIIGLQDSINNTVIIGCFGVVRMRCNKHCNYSQCNICTSFLDIDKVVEEAYSNEH